MIVWTYEWPTEEGWYWFHGWEFRPFPDDEPPKTIAVEVWKIGSGGYAYVCRGHFLHKADGAYGTWTRAKLPPGPGEIEWKGK